MEEILNNWGEKDKTNEWALTNYVPAVAVRHKEQTLFEVSGRKRVEDGSRQ